MSNQKGVENRMFRDLGEKGICIPSNISDVKKYDPDKRVRETCIKRR